MVSIEPENLEFSADEQLVEQVLINLIKNSVHALENKPGGRIDLKGFTNKRGRVTIQVTDNGQGILPEVMDKIFIPFFTTKQSGSGNRPESFKTDPPFAQWIHYSEFGAGKGNYIHLNILI